MKMTNLLTMLSFMSLQDSPAISKLTNVTVVLAGESAILNCTGPNVNWRFHPLGHNGHDITDKEIYIFDKLTSEFEQKGFLIDGNTTAGEVNLFITNVTTDMAGNYECRFGESHDQYESVQLIVLAISKLTKTSVDTVVVLAGDSAILNCTGPYVNWRFHPLWHNGHDITDKEIYIFDKLIPEFEQKGFLIDGNTAPAEVNLFITNVSTDMAGTYECRIAKGQDPHESVQLIVLESNPYCQMTPVSDDSVVFKTCEIPPNEFIGSNTCDLPQDGFVGPNTCGLPQHNISLLCSVEYFGNASPVLELKRLGESKVIKSCSNETESVIVTKQRLTCDVTINADSDLDGAQFIFQTTQSALRQYNYTTEPLKILYSFNGDLSSREITLGEEVDCTANCSQPCGYKWTWSEKVSQSERHSVEYFTKVLKVTRTGSYRCEAICQIGKHSCKVTPMIVKVISPTASEQEALEMGDQRKMYVPVICIIIGLAVALIFGVIFKMTSGKGKTPPTPTSSDASDTQEEETSLRESIASENDTDQTISLKKCDNGDCE